jgi:preprotein translocase subunit SecD
MRGVIAAALLLAASVAASADPDTFSVAGASVERPLGQPPALSIQLSPASTAAFAVFTRANVGKTIVLTVDGKSILTATLRDPILGGTVMVSGDFSTADLDALAAALSTAGRVEAAVQSP